MPQPIKPQPITATERIAKLAAVGTGVAFFDSVVMGVSCRVALMLYSCVRVGWRAFTTFLSCGLNAVRRGIAIDYISQNRATFDLHGLNLLIYK
ncbi:MAG: hypothetical protein NVS3B20_27130 [Polyangiales bacterium]